MAKSYHGKFGRQSFRRIYPNSIDCNKNIPMREEYWNDYVCEELGDTLWVLTTIQGSMYNEDRSEITAWMSIRKRGGRCQLRVFGFDRNESATLTIAEAMEHLFKVTLHQNGEKNSKSADNGIVLHLPTIVLSDIQEDATPIHV
eukprot:CCRYP_003357-RA/>CCRYP_003357-RA protein AED:0.26 eAED:0.43 QI:0/0/0/1/0/0/2/0/143